MALVLALVVLPLLCKPCGKLENEGYRSLSLSTLISQLAFSQSGTNSSKSRFPLLPSLPPPSTSPFPPRLECLNFQLLMRSLRNLHHASKNMERSSRAITTPKEITPTPIIFHLLSPVDVSSLSFPPFKLESESG